MLNIQSFDVLYILSPECGMLRFLLEPARIFLKFHVLIGLHVQFCQGQVLGGLPLILQYYSRSMHILERRTLTHTLYGPVAAGIRVSLVLVLGVVLVVLVVVLAVVLVVSSVLVVLVVLAVVVVMVFCVTHCVGVDQCCGAGFAVLGSCAGVGDGVVGCVVGGGAGWHVLLLDVGVVGWWCC